jgi:hypothetical protein
MASLLKNTHVLVNPNLFSGSYEIKHDQGLMLNNRVRYKTKNPILLVMNRSHSYILGILGYPVSRNDIYWRKILKYAQSDYGYEK